MIKIITYTDNRMTISAGLCMRSARDMGADEQYAYGPNDLPVKFRFRMSHLLDQERGAGFYCWKPKCVEMAADGMKNGDYLVWSDAGTTWLEHINKLIECMDEDIMFFTNGFKQVDWCKMDCLSAMLSQLPLPAIKISEALQVQASHIIFKITDETRDFIDRWYWWSIQPCMIDNEPSKIPNYPEFREHRWDQSILTNLQMSAGYKLHWFPSTMFMNDQWRRQPGDTYAAMFDHHRKRNEEW